MRRLRLCLCCALPFLLASGAHAARIDPSPNIIVVTAPRPAAKIGPHVHHHAHREHRHEAAKRMPVCGRGGPASAYSASSGVAFTGRIDKVTFQPGRTILVVHDRGGETCAYLPSRAELAKRGLPPALLRRDTPVMIEGFAHRNDKRKVLVQRLVSHPRD